MLKACFPEGRAIWHSGSVKYQNTLGVRQPEWPIRGLVPKNSNMKIFCSDLGSDPKAET
jgi:hypothetical protein